MYPKTYFQDRPPRPEPGYCVVLMPFHGQFDPVWAAIREALTVDFDCRRVDELLEGGNVMEHVLREIARADIVIADLTSRNPNVFYELGIAHMVKDAKKVLIVSQTADDVPFDLRSYNFRAYQQTVGGLRDLQTHLVRAAKQAAERTFYFYIMEGKTYSSTEKTKPLRGDDGGLYSFEISGILLGEDGVDCDVALYRHLAGDAPRRVGGQPFRLIRGRSERLPGIPWRIKLEPPEGGTQGDSALLCVVPDDAGS